jgi:chemotaxis protein MotB
MAGGKHHFGGSWKIAYGDFITSMFALFLVLWILSFDEITKRAVEDYFRGKKTQVIQGQRGVLEKTTIGTVRTDPIDKASKDLLSINPTQKALENVREQLKNSAEIGEDLIRFEFEADGVRITAFDNAKKPFFAADSSEITPFGAFMMQTLAYELDRLPVQIEVEGHVEKSESGKPGQASWDLSAQRAMSAQESLTGGGVKPDQFYRVAGYADKRPLKDTPPASELNRRIEILVRPNDMQAVHDMRQTFQKP